MSLLGWFILMYVVHSCYMIKLQGIYLLYISFPERWSQANIFPLPLTLDSRNYPFLSLNCMSGFAARWRCLHCHWVSVLTEMSLITDKRWAGTFFEQKLHQPEKQKPKRCTSASHGECVQWIAFHSPLPLLFARLVSNWSLVQMPESDANPLFFEW